MNNKVIVALLVMVALLTAALLKEHLARTPASRVSQVAGDGSVGPKLPAPHLPPAASDPAVSPQDSPVKRMLKGDFPAIAARDLEPYLAANHRNLESLLAAYRVTGDTNLLREAAEKFPKDPRLAWESWFRTQDKAERQKWLETWEKGAPGNALATYLSAGNLFKMGDTDAALQKLMSATGKSDMSFYAEDSVLGAEDAYRAAGYSEAQAKAAATMGLLLPQLAELKALGKSLGELSAAYRQAGDGTSAQSVLGLGVQMGSRLSTGQNTVIEELVSVAVQANLLKSMDPSGPSGLPGTAAQDLLNLINTRKDDIKATVRDTEPLLESLNEQELIAWCDRVRLLGEYKAMQWLKAKYSIAPGTAGP